MNIIIGIIIALVVLGVLYGLLCIIIKKYPILIWISGLVVGIMIAAISYWWVGLIVGLIIAGLLKQAEESGGHQCAHCESYDTYITSDENGCETWKCNKCEKITTGMKRH